MVYRLPRSRARLFVAALASSVATAAVAGSASNPPAEQPYGWLLTVKGNVLVSPEFPGADSYSFIAYPSLSLRRAGTAEGFNAPDDGISLALFGNSSWSAGLVGRYQTGRYSGDDRKLTGLHDARWAVEPGLFAEYWPLQDTVRLRGEMRFGLNGYNGLVGNLSLDYVHRVGKFVISGGPRMAISGTDYMETYFGVTAQDALNNAAVTAYKPDAGIKSVGLAAAATYKWNESWATTVNAGYDRLVGSAADSPIVKNLGTTNQFTFGASASYTFPLGYAER